MRNLITEILVLVLCFLVGRMISETYVCGFFAYFSATFINAVLLMLGDKR